jgi:O-antigen/teichoic acid export membrane protein
MSLKKILVNSGWSLGSFVLPAVAALFAFPWLAQHLGLERLGLLSLAWIIVGYFSVFDLGIGRSLTVMVAEARGSKQDVPKGLIASGVTATIGLGLVASALLGVVGWLFIDRGQYSASIRPEVATSVVYIMLCAPFVVVGAGLRGLIEGFEAFQTSAVIRGPTGAAVFLFPCLVVLWSPTLDAAVLASLLARVVAVVALGWALKALTPIEPRAANAQWFLRLVTAGGWNAVSSTLGPIITYGDRLVLAATSSAKSIAFYATPFELISRVLLIPISLSTSMLPTLIDVRQRDPRAATALVNKTTLINAMAMLTLCAPLALLAPWWLSLWMGSSFAEQSYGISLWLIVAFGVNGLAHIPATNLLSLSKAKNMAIWNLVQLPLYVVALVAASARFGALGTAWVAAARSLIDWLVLELMSRRR